MSGFKLFVFVFVFVFFFYFLFRKEGLGGERVEARKGLFMDGEVEEEEEARDRLT